MFKFRCFLYTSLGYCIGYGGFYTLRSSNFIQIASKLGVGYSSPQQCFDFLPDPQGQ